MKRLLMLVSVFVGAAGCGEAPPAIGESQAALGDSVCDQVGCVSQSKLLAQLDAKLSAGLGGANGVTGFAVEVGSATATGGFARTATDAPPSGAAMSTTAITDIASVSKIITTVAVLQSMAKHHISLDAPVYPYLWKWTAGLNVDNITFRDLLTQRSGFRNEANDCCPSGNCNTQYVECGGNQTSYAILQNVWQTGVSTANHGNSCYNNCNFALFRELLPVMEGNTWTAADGDQATWSANFYVSYVNQHIFAPLGIPTRACQPPASNEVLYYPQPAGKTPGTDFSQIDPSTGLPAWNAKVCGAGGWFLTLDDLQKIATDLATGTTLLTAAEKATMFHSSDETHALGWDNTVGRDCPAPNLCKNGGLGDGLDKEATLHTYMGIYKCSVPVVAVVNSPLPGTYEQGGDNNGYGDIIGVVADSYTASSTKVAGLCCDGSPTCGGNCCSGGQICEGGSCVAPPGNECLGNDFCWSGDCYNGVCSCMALDQQCRSNGDCCSQHCSNGECVCAPLGSACSGVSCCGGNVCTNGICALPKPPTTCNGSHPPGTCSAGWHCCGSDGWRCGVCI